MSGQDMASRDFWRTKIQAFEADQREGIGDDRAYEDFLLYQEAAGMSAEEFASNRERLGLQKSTADFLLGQ
jgi:hypothetical protein